jgi:hypothetical protein
MPTLRKADKRWQQVPYFKRIFMGKGTTLLFILLFPLLCLAQNTLVIKDVAVIDVVNSKVKSGLTVTIKGNRISSVSSKATVPRNATVIDGKDMYLIPGLWDMHAHSFTDTKFEWLFPLLIVNGVTGVRDMTTALPFDSIHWVRKQISEGKLLGPRFGGVTQKNFNGINLPGVPDTVVTTPAEGRERVRDYKQQKMDFIKVYNQLSREVFLAVTDEARLQKIPVSGHVPYSMTAGEVSDLGQISIEHNTDILVSCSSEETKLRRELDTLPKNLAIGAAPRQNVDWKAFQTFDEQKAIRLFNRFTTNGTWICPTLVIFPRSQKTNDELLQDDRLKYIPQRFRDQWINQMKQRNINPPSENGKLLMKKRIDIVGLMHKTGVRILAGSDFMNPYIYPGFSLHDELELLVQAGLTPMQALQAATVNPARFFGQEEEFGTVEKGKLADLVLLNANPLDDIRHTKKIAAVIINGRLLQRMHLDALLKQVEDKATKEEKR